MNILQEEYIEPNYNRNSITPQSKGIESKNSLKELQSYKNNMNNNTLDTFNSSIDLLKVSDTTLEICSSNDGKQ